MVARRSTGSTFFYHKPVSGNIDNYSPVTELQVVIGDIGPLVGAEHRNRKADNAAGEGGVVGLYDNSGFANNCILALAGECLCFLSEEPKPAIRESARENGPKGKLNGQGVYSHDVGQKSHSDCRQTKPDNGKGGDYNFEDGDDDAGYNPNPGFHAVPPQEYQQVAEKQDLDIKLSLPYWKYSVNGMFGVITENA